MQIWCFLVFVYYMPKRLKTNTPRAKTPPIFLNKSVFKAGIKAAKPYHKKNSQIHQFAKDEGKVISLLLEV
jgi:hypothetical protein